MLPPLSWRKNFSAASAHVALINKKREQPCGQAADTPRKSLILYDYEVGDQQIAHPGIRLASYRHHNPSTIKEVR
jgi:hypothetical protein